MIENIAPAETPTALALKDATARRRELEKKMMAAGLSPRNDWGDDLVMEFVQAELDESDAWLADFDARHSQIAG